MKTDAVVIGAGVSGMSAALALARHGQRVVLVERRRQPGPLLRRFRRGHAWCDGGFHYTGGFAEDGTLDVLFRYFGVRERLEPVPMNPDGFDRIITAEGIDVRIPNGMDRVRLALRQAFPRSGAAIDAYITEVDRIHRSTPFIGFDFKSEAVMSVRKGTPLSLDAFLAAAGAEEELIRMLGAYGQVLYGTGGAEIPMDFHAMVLGSLYDSACMLRGGGDSIVQALEAGLAREGVTIMCGQPVRRIAFQNGRIRAVELDGETIECRACIATPHPRQIGALLEPGMAPALRQRVERTENSFGLFAIFFELDDVPPSLCRSNLYRIYSPQHILAILCCGPVEEGEKPSFVAFMPSLIDPAQSREHYAREKAAETQRVLAAVHETLPELRGRARVIETASPRTYEALTGTDSGAAYGIRQTVSRRPLTTLTGIDGFFLAGQSILVAGVMGAMISGFVAAAQVVDIKTIWNEIQRCRKEKS